MSTDKLTMYQSFAIEPLWSVSDLEIDGNAFKNIYEKTG